MRLTRRGGAVLVAAGVLFGVGQWLGYPMFLALAGISAGAVVAAVVVTTRRTRIAVTREVYPDRVPRENPAFARLRVHNPSTRRQSGFTAGDRVGTGFHTVAVRPLAPGAQAVYHYELPTTLRGRHQVGPLVLNRVDAFGLASSRLSTGDTTTLWVHPRTYPVNAIAGAFPRHHHEGEATDSALRGSLDVREVREYVVGDEVRHLHWKATARTGRLMVRDYADPDQPRFTTLLDNRRETPAGPLFEEAVDLAASLIVSAAKADHRCRLVTSSGVDIATAGGMAPVRQLLDELSLLCHAEDPGLPIVPGALSRGGGGTLVVVSTALGQADRAALAAVRPRFPDLVVITIGGQPAPIPGARVLSATGAMDATRKWNAVIA